MLPGWRRTSLQLGAASNKKSELAFGPENGLGRDIEVAQVLGLIKQPLL
jgi:hypothetical protein